MKTLTGRGAMHSPGAPSLRSEIERLFWNQIATGITSGKVAEAVGVSSAVGTRWFRHRDGIHRLSSLSQPLVIIVTGETQGIGQVEAERLAVFADAGVGASAG